MQKYIISGESRDDQIRITIVLMEPKRGLGTGDWITIIAAVLGIAAVVFHLDWTTRSFLVAAAIGLIVFAALRHSAHPFIRAIVAAIATTAFVALSWRPIWEDFHKEYPATLPQVALLYAVLAGIVVATCLLTYRLASRPFAKGRQKLDPFLAVALLGAVLVVAGIGGYAVSNGLGPTTTVIAVAAPPSKPADAPLKPMFTAYDIEQRLRAIDTLLEYLDPKLMTVSALGEKINQTIYKRIDDGSAIADLDNFADTMNATLTGYFALAARYERFPDIHMVAVQHDWPVMDIPKIASLLRAELQEMTQRGQLQQGMNLGDLFKNNKLMHDWRSVTMGRLWTWINQKQTALIGKRREYENAPVYPAN